MSRRRAYPAAAVMWVSVGCNAPATDAVTSEASTDPPAYTASTPPSAPPEVAAPPPQPVAPLSSNARTEDERNTVDVFRDAARSTVFVGETRVVVDWFAGVAEEVPAGSGSGFVWDNRGHIVTNYHVVAGARALTVTFQEEKSFDATIVGVEPHKDIAVLRVTAPPVLLHPIRIPKRFALEVGQKTIAIGNPFGLDHTLTTGVVSALGRQVKGVGGVTIRDMVQTDAAINPGNSGGPLLDSAGELIGMNTIILSRSGTSAGIGFAVPVATIARVVPQIIRSGRAEQIGIGVEIDPQQRIERRFGIRGVAVIAVAPGGPAERAGVRGLGISSAGIELGDVIVGIDGQKIVNYDDFYNSLDNRRAGERASLQVQRGEAVIRLDVELATIE